MMCKGCGVDISHPHAHHGAPLYDSWVCDSCNRHVVLARMLMMRVLSSQTFRSGSLNPSGRHPLSEGVGDPDQGIMPSYCPYYPSPLINPNAGPVACFSIRVNQREGAVGSVELHVIDSCPSG